MKGTIVVVDLVYQQGGLISGNDGIRYKFTNQEWRGGTVPPNQGMDVDFVIEGEIAKEIYPLVSQQGNFNQPPFNQAQPGQNRPSQNQPIPNKGDQNTPKSKTTFILLGIFLGSLGVHDFYAGYNGKGTAHLLISVLSVFTLAIASQIWAWIEIATVKEDSQGIPMV